MGSKEKKEKAPRRAIGWDTWYAAAKEYYEREGNLLVPARYVTLSGLRLGYWINRLRNKYNNWASAGRALYQDEIQAMEAIGMVWRMHRQPEWQEWIVQAGRYYDEHGDLLVPLDYTVDGMNLSAWLRQQRLKYHRGELTKEQIADLERCGISWSRGKRRDWETYYDLAKKYYEKHGDLLVPQNYETEDGHTLGKWIAGQRGWYVRDAAHQRCPLMPQEKIQRLEQIGMIWRDVRKLRWDKMYAFIEDYVRMNGGLPPWDSHLCAPDGRRVNDWLNHQRTALRKGTLSDEQISCLQRIGLTE